MHMFPFWGNAIGKGINFPEIIIKNGINLHNFGIRNGTDFQDFRMKCKVGYTFSKICVTVRLGILFQKIGLRLIKNGYLDTEKRITFAQI